MLDLEGFCFCFAHVFHHIEKGVCLVTIPGQDASCKDEKTSHTEPQSSQRISRKSLLPPHLCNKRNNWWSISCHPKCRLGLGCPLCSVNFSYLLPLALSIFLYRSFSWPTRSDDFTKVPEVTWEITIIIRLTLDHLYISAAKNDHIYTLWPTNPSYCVHQR